MAHERSSSRVQRVKQGVREFAYVTGVSSGCTGFLNAADRLRRMGLYVFIGHHVLDSDDSGSILTAERLHDRLVYLSKHFDLVSISKGLEWLRDPRPGDRLAAITFDDGYRDNLTVGLDVLEAVGAPATFFVCTEPVLTASPFWFDTVRSALASERGAAASVPWLAPMAERAVADGQFSLADAVVDTLNRQRPADRSQMVDELVDALDYDTGMMPAHLQPLSAGELARFAASPLVTIGAHTHSHSVVSCCSEDELRDELSENVTALEQITGERPSIFAYPKGATETSALSVPELLDEVQMEAAFTTQRQINRMNADRWMLGRFPLGAGPVSAFAWELMQLSF